MRLPNAPQHFQPIDGSDADVEYHSAELLGGDRTERLLGIFRGERLIALSAQPINQELSNIGIIIDEEDLATDSLNPGMRRMRPQGQRKGYLRPALRTM